MWNSLKTKGAIAEMRMEQTIQQCECEKIVRLQREEKKSHFHFDNLVPSLSPQKRK